MSDYTRADAERIAGRIGADLRANHNYRATARGLARSNMMREGLLPGYVPAALTQNLDEQLSAIGAGLLQSGLEARDVRAAVPDLEDVLPAARVDRAFEFAGECFEALVRNGDRETEERGFYYILSGAAYHLGRFSARAFNVLQKADNTDRRRLTLPEKVLRNLILRRFTRIDVMIEGFLNDNEWSDEVLAGRLEDTEEAMEEIDVVHHAMQENYCRAIASFVYALRMGTAREVDRALALLARGEEFCLENGFVTDWWVNRISRHLLSDLWQHSLRLLLPVDPAGDAPWNNLRHLFIAALASRKLAEVELWPSQVGLMPRLLDESDDLIASLPTSAGKTRIAELCILRCLAGKRRAVFVTPLRSLSAQTERTLRRTFCLLGFDVSSLYGAAGTTAGDADSLGNRDIVVCTPEKLDFALRNDSSLLDDVGLVVFDEGHMLGPTDRGLRYEILVQRLLRRSDQQDRRVVCLSAMLPDGEMEDDFVSWLRSGVAGVPLKNAWRPTRQRFGTIGWDEARESYRYEVKMGDETSFVLDFVQREVTVGPRGGVSVFPSTASELCLVAATRLAREGQSVLIYCPQKNFVRQMARRFVDLLSDDKLPAVDVDKDKIKQALFVGQEWLPENDPVLVCLQAGIAVHHASLPRAFLRELDGLLADGVLKVTIASPTLAQGLNLSASCLLLQSFTRFNNATRKQELLPAHEIANVAGRAGRAFVDNDGQVIGVCRNVADERQWRRLRESVAQRKLESGLLQLVDVLLERLRQSLPESTWAETAEYILNQHDFWSDPPEELAESEEWINETALLDSALLSLLGDIEADAEVVASKLDEMLKDSFLLRRMARGNGDRRDRVMALLKSRSSYIWRQTSTAQRRGYFFAGVGLTTGQALDAAAPELNQLIVNAEAALESGDEKGAIEALTAIAKRVFIIEPFVPDDLPDKWPELLDGWLKGQPLAVLCAIHENASDIVEGAFVFRLTWAIDAVRVRSEANEEGIFGEVSLRCTAALEAGSISQQVAILIYAGLPSRTAAQEALRVFPSDFNDFRGMRGWLAEPHLQEAAKDPTWPTVSTAMVWQEFLAHQNIAAEPEWQQVSVEMVLPASFPFEAGTEGWVRPTEESDVAEFLNTEMASGGKIYFTFPEKGPTWARARVLNGLVLRIDYLGPWPAF